jgi:tetratricopeptide (TPR) repeat protein
MTTQGEHGVAQRLKELHRMIMDPSKTFSASATLKELDELEASLSPMPVEARGELNYIRGFVLYRVGRAEEALGPSSEALRIDASHPFLPASERSHFLYSLANQAEEVGAWDIAIDAYTQVIPLFDADPGLSEDQRLGTRESLAFCLHEAEQYAKAFSINASVLASGERLFGPDSDKLLVVITNLAQNAHKLRELDKAKAFLERRLDIALKHDVTHHVDEALFQLGVLAYEQGQLDEAEAFMQRRLALALGSDDPSRIEEAEEALQMLHTLAS